ncbi:(4Fe-4S)-binding protein, partial [Alistipes onderdonkii]
VATQGDCDFCFACIQNCPQKAIRFRQDSGDPLLARGERNPDARYRNEHVSLMDIKRANSR